MSQVDSFRLHSTSVGEICICSTKHSGKYRLATREVHAGARHRSTIRWRPVPETRQTTKMSQRAMVQMARPRVESPRKSNAERLQRQTPEPPETYKVFVQNLPIPLGWLVELAGIEPASSSVEPGL